MTVNHNSSPDLSNVKRTVVIPACAEHGGFFSLIVTLPWVCPVCGGPRGEPFETVSWDGSTRLYCHGWLNPCGHIDKYSAVRDEYRRALDAASGESEASS